jgi:VWFA-related protein
MRVIAPVALLASTLAAFAAAATQPPALPPQPTPPSAAPAPSASSTPPSPEQPPSPPAEPTFRTRTSGVRIDVLVTDNDRPVPNLTAADFELTDSGVAQQIEVISLRDLTVDVIVVLDTSASLGDDGLRHLLSATDTLIGGLRDGDRAALVTFSRGVMMQSALTPDHDRVRGILNGLKSEGATSVIDATYAATTLRTQSDRSALMLVFSDGVDTTSWLRPEKVLGTVRRSSVVPYAVVVGEAAAAIAGAPAADPARPPEPRDPIDATDSFLRDLVMTGGGLFMPAGQTSQLDRHFAEALDNFRQRYVLTYTPRGVDARGWHPVTVKVKGRHRVRARPGYVVQ